ncbi:GNAT family N-acetyltransferase [Kineosporia babensis]|uniref:GNAT family N-acetyltransferase n=1 Tax=Kineosporia babensis TaxID=499548 RepID=A0A9X1NK46_9ACTN|nr:GNAT family N-acetyltransferase [Kineosporia babensis]MCD5315064.1 GNAT family N-acetyltransferase [Kineosporia babensis]
MPIRLAHRDDLTNLQQIERAAGEAFRTIGMPEVADDEPFSIEELLAYQGRTWVYERDGEAVAYLLIDLVDSLFHIEQVTVHPRAARQGIGRALIEHVYAQAPQQKLTLTTFEQVPWNAPYYRRLNFETFASPGPELQQVRRREAEHGLDRWPRLCMIRTH